jgi:GNAT superfamily N-acetyltransferase
MRYAMRDWSARSRSNDEQGMALKPSHAEKPMTGATAPLSHGLRSIDVAPAPLDAILPMREDYRREMNCQIVHDSWHHRGFTQSFIVSVAAEVVGYGSVGGVPPEPKMTVKEFFIRPDYRGVALPMFRRLVAVSGALGIEAQTNDVLLTLMLHDVAVDLVSDTILFADALTTDLRADSVAVRRLTDVDRATVFRHTREPIGDWGLEAEHAIVATGGLLFHYNPPYGDLYMEVDAPFRRRGFGSYLVQELKRICRESGHTPAARCNAANTASRLTLQRAGMFPCARIVRGRIAV